MNACERCQRAEREFARLRTDGTDVGDQQYRQAGVWLERIKSEHPHHNAEAAVRATPTTPTTRQRSIVNALLAVRETVGAVAKEYDASLDAEVWSRDAVMRAVAPALVKHRVIVTPRVVDRQVDIVNVAGSHRVVVHAVVVVEYTFTVAGGDSKSVVVAGAHQDDSGNAVSAAMTKAERTAYTQVLSLATGERSLPAQRRGTPLEAVDAEADLMGEVIARGAQAGYTAGMVRGMVSVALNGGLDVTPERAIAATLDRIEAAIASGNLAAAEEPAVDDSYAVASELAVEALTAEVGAFTGLFARAKLAGALTVDVRAALPVSALEAQGVAPVDKVTLGVWLAVMETARKVEAAAAEASAVVAAAGGDA